MPPAFISNINPTTSVLGQSLGTSCHFQPRPLLPPGASTPPTPLHSSSIPHHSAYSCLWPLLCPECLSSLFCGKLLVTSQSPVQILPPPGSQPRLWGLGWAPSSRALVYQCSRLGAHGFQGTPFTAASGTAHRRPQRVSTSTVPETAC